MNKWKIWKCNVCESTLTGHSDMYVSFLPVFFPEFLISLLLLIRVLASYTFRVLSVVWSPDGKQIVSGSSDKTIKIWDSQSGNCQSTLTGHLSWYVFFMNMLEKNNKKIMFLFWVPVRQTTWKGNFLLINTYSKWHECKRFQIELWRLPGDWPGTQTCTFYFCICKRKIT